MEAITPHRIINKKPSDYCIVCVKDSILTVGTPEMETIIFDKFPKFETLCRVLSENILAKNRTSFDESKISSLQQRYLNLLQTRPDLVQRIPQHQLASSWGIKPQPLSRLKARVATKKI